MIPQSDSWIWVGGGRRFISWGFHIDFGEAEWHFDTLDLVFQEFDDQQTIVNLGASKMFQTSKTKFNCETYSKRLFLLILLGKEKEILQGAAAVNLRVEDTLLKLVEKGSGRKTDLCWAANFEHWSDPSYFDHKSEVIGYWW